MKSVEKPLNRSKFRAKAGMVYYGLVRKFLWLTQRKNFAKELSTDSLPYTYYSHKTILRRKLKDVDMWMHENKIVNLNIAVKRLDGLVIRPGETFSYWYLIGRPTASKGYVEGMILKDGGFTSSVGGGLCQLSNLIFWMTIHTPLTVTERHRHGYDVFPDSNRTQPFGSGATCFYPHVDLMIKNETDMTFRLAIKVGETHLEGAIEVSSEPKYRFEIVEKNHEMKQEYWCGYTRHNDLYQEVYDLEGQLLDERLIVSNSAIMMYAPFLEDGSDGDK